jgi:hypothetical protein
MSTEFFFIESTGHTYFECVFSCGHLVWSYQDFVILNFMKFRSHFCEILYRILDLLKVFDDVQLT